MKPQPPSAMGVRRGAPVGPRETPCKISHKDRRPCTIMAPELAGWLAVARIYPVTSSATVMTRRSLLQLALYSACKPRVYVPFRALVRPLAPRAHSRDNGAGTTKLQGCDVAPCATRLSQFVSFARGARHQIARRVALRPLPGIKGFAGI